MGYHSDISMVRALPEDAFILTAIARRSKAHWGYPSRWMKAWRGVLTVGADFILQTPVFRAEVGQETLGFYALAASDQRAWLEHFWVLPEAMGQGVGRLMFAHAAQQAAQMRVTSLMIEADPHALGFYERMGARRVGQTVGRLDGRPRILPVLIYDIEPPFDSRA